MARWSREDKTLHAKVVYYGPACGGKTANLEALHRVADTRHGHELLTVNTQKDSTLFFDLLPFELDDVLGCRISIKLYTVPGQVRYDATRKVVLGEADAIVFVADSCPSRREQNVWSMQNLRMNMRAKDVDPERVPILFQINKRDVPDAAPAAGDVQGGLSRDGGPCLRPGRRPAPGDGRCRGSGAGGRSGPRPVRGSRSARVAG